MCGLLAETFIMEDVEQQLAALRKRIAHIDRKFGRKYGRNSARPPAPPATRVVPRHSGQFIEELLSGEVVRTSRGKHFETERFWEPHRRHGSWGIGDLALLPNDLLCALSDGSIAAAPPASWAFLDTETTGLRAAYAFLIGIGWMDAGGFRLRQFFLRDESEEASALARMAEHLSRFEVLITYNGRAYDQPLLENRLRAMRIPAEPLRRLRHLDILAGARRLWKLRLASCRLMDLEYRILGVERHGDLPGAMIPYYYFDYLRSRQAMSLVPIFHHNAMDILSLACLTAVVSAAFHAPEKVACRHGEDLIGLARWLLRAAKRAEALAVFRRAVEVGLPDELLFRTLWDIAVLEKKLGRVEEARAAFRDLTGSRNPYRDRAVEALGRIDRRLAKTMRP
ncbi:MAG TPA: ribonuclease H-like domain-containing protein [Bryobacteraceae bacterium]|nr:ribonuclease H-like domain-containing protein [Bryobacteraceae bacterium]